MKQFIFFVLGISSLLLSTLAVADCHYNGQWVPTGTQAGGYTCQANGEWR